MQTIDIIIEERNLMEESTFGTAKCRPLFLCRWWLKTRDIKNPIQLNPGEGIPPAVEFYVPWWAWPLELLHRLIFGHARLK